MKTKLAVLLTCLLLAARMSLCSEPTADQKFEALAHHYINRTCALQPEEATDLGDHRFDDRLDDRSPAGVARLRRFTERTLTALMAIPVESLETANRVDASLLREQLQNQLFEIDTLRSLAWNPLYYNVGDAIDALLTRNFAPIEVRMRNVQARLEAIPSVLAQARQNLHNPPRIHTETAILQNQGTISLIRDDLPRFIAKVPSMKKSLLAARRTALEALQSYGSWLKDDLLPRSHGNYRIGDQKFREKLRFTLGSSLSEEEILAHAKADLAKTQSEIYEVALPLFRKYFPEQLARLGDHHYVVSAVLDRLAEERPTASTIVPIARKWLARATRFVHRHHLVTLPTEPVRVIVMPEFERGVAVAYCDPPGPLETGRTFYAISPPPAGWNAAQVTSYFKEDNDSMLADLTVHEAMPGHYVQLWHARQVVAPTKLRALFESGVFVEGWAVYAEQMMAEQGFGGPKEHMEQLKIRLRVIINAILDQKIHAGNMTRSEAMNLMINQGYQEEGEAAGKWRRACLTSTQLSTYFVGVTEVNAIRKAWEARHGRGHLRQFHDTLLSFGSLPPQYIKKLMGL